MISEAEGRLMERVEESVFSFLSERCDGEALKRGVLVATSGGPDSTALLMVLNALQNRLDFPLSGAYIDHGLRNAEEIKREVKFLQTLCEARNISFYRKSIPPGEIAKAGRKHRRGIEAQARIFRYQFLQQLQEKNNLFYIALGHTLDDQIETQIMRFFQGSGVIGLVGIPAVRENIIRPFLDLEKNSIIEYLKKRGISYSEDSSNSSLEYRRNRIRHELIPPVKSVFPGAAASLSTSRERMQYLGDLIDELLDTELVWDPYYSDEQEKSLLPEPGGYTISLDRFNKSSRFLREESLYRRCDDLLKTDDARLPYRFVREMTELIAEASKWDSTKRGSPSKKILNQGHGIALAVGNNQVFLMRYNTPSEIVLQFRGTPKKSGYVIVGERGKSYIIDTQGKKITILGIKQAGEMRESRNSGSETTLKVSNVVPPLILRNKFPGDYIVLRTGKRSISKILKNWKVPTSTRIKIPVLQDRKGVIGICGAPFGYTNKLAKRVELEDINVTGEDQWIINVILPPTGSGYGKE